MQSLKSFAGNVIAGIVATAVWTALTATLHWPFGVQFAAGLVTIAVAAGLPVLVTLLLRQGRRTALDVRRVETAVLPDWARNIARVAEACGIKVFLLEGSVVFENAAGEQHLATANPPGSGVIERERTLTMLEKWGVPMQVAGMGKRVPTYPVVSS